MMRPIARRGSNVLLGNEADPTEPGLIVNLATGEQTGTGVSVTAILLRGYWHPIEDGDDVEVTKGLSQAFGSKRKRQNQLVARLKRRRGYKAPVRGGTGAQSRTRRSKFNKADLAKHYPGGKDHEQANHGERGGRIFPEPPEWAQKWPRSTNESAKGRVNFIANGNVRDGAAAEIEAEVRSVLDMVDEAGLILPRDGFDVIPVTGNEMRKLGQKGVRRAVNAATVGRRLYVNQSWKPNEFALARNRTETIIHEMGHFLAGNSPPNISKEYSRLAGTDSHERFAEAFLAVMTGQAEQGTLDEMAGMLTVWGSDEFAKHYPGGKDHDQSNHGRRGNAVGSPPPRGSTEIAPGVFEGVSYPHTTPDGTAEVTEYTIDGRRVHVRRHKVREGITEQIVNTVRSVPDDVWAAADDPTVMFTDTDYMTTTEAPSGQKHVLRADGLYWAGGETGGWAVIDDNDGERHNPTGMVWVYDNPKYTDEYLLHNLTHELGHGVYYKRVLDKTKETWREVRQDVFPAFRNLLNVIPDPKNRKRGEEWFRTEFFDEFDVEGTDIWAYPRTTWEMTEAWAEAFAFLQSPRFRDRVRSDFQKAFESPKKTDINPAREKINLNDWFDNLFEEVGIS